MLPQRRKVDLWQDLAAELINYSWEQQLRSPAAVPGPMRGAHVWENEREIGSGRIGNYDDWENTGKVEVMIELAKRRLAGAMTSIVTTTVPPFPFSLHPTWPLKGPITRRSPAERPSQ